MISFLKTRPVISIRCKPAITSSIWSEMLRATCAQWERRMANPTYMF